MVTKNLGDQVTFTANASGGSPPYNYNWTGLPSPVQNSNTNVIKGVPANAGTYNVNVKVTDSAGNNGSASGILIVNAGPGPLTISLQISPNSITLGQQATFSAMVNGGKSPYSYSWTNLPSPIQGSNTSTLNGTPSNAGTYNTNVLVTDSTGATANASATLVVSSSPVPAQTGAQINSGTYVGNNNQNRPISHGLKNTTPKLVQIMRNDGAGTFFILASGNLVEISGNGYNSSAIKSADNNNFYVGDNNHNANWNGYTYYWVALG